jgi:hypothetical protein
MKLFAVVLADTAFGYASSNICPSEDKDPCTTDENGVNFCMGLNIDHLMGCYTQKPAIWTPDTEVECEMTNPSCLMVTCDGANMKAKINGNLFHRNEKHSGLFADQLVNGDRSLKFNGVELVQGDPCGYEVEASDQFGQNAWITIDWDYKTCGDNFDPTIVGDHIVYSVKLESYGNDADTNGDIEFYVNTAIEAVCEYDRDIVTNPVKFYVNQEDTLMTELSDGKLDDVVECNFYIDEQRTKLINSNNIVNMGQTIYGRVDSKLKIGDLRYRLTDLVVRDGNENSTKSFHVIKDNENTAEVNAVSDGSANTGSTLDFSYMSFGFEDLEHQNKLQITCGVSIEKGLCSDFICEDDEDKVVVDDKCECAFKTVEVIFYPASDAEAGTSKAPGPAPDLYIGPDMYPGSPDYNILGTEELSAANGFIKTEPFKFQTGDWLWIKAKSSNGAAVAAMQILICYNVGQQEPDCKIRNAKFFQEDSFWIDEASTSLNSCQSTEGTIPDPDGDEGDMLCAAMGDDSFKIRNCFQEGKIELTFDAEAFAADPTSFSDTELELVQPDCW